tara:strand:- start:152 stop:418 length:267 start_codon:yes stop_codon:yes gene_type:complete
MALTIGSSTNGREAKATYRSICGGLREVIKHHRNILGSVDDSGALHALKAMELVDRVQSWREASLAELGSFGIDRLEIRQIEEECRVV